ncbi:hypothetical protein OE88DRAFT_1736841 [Heliocybe sulcata]|uniref:Uncharacterized protein n=1 Tax=Heliocybe sulcata TaxID=5364 RepID=A0A5C3MVM9_9AGAM|nr:hypothetical protein OE88DRAFT_1736841 [Heliocybe sulcata]
MPSTHTEGNSIIELRGAAFEWLGPGRRITVLGVEYEYADSDADDDSIDDAVGPGRTFGKLVKRVAAPLETCLSFCSDLLGNGPDAAFTRFMCRECPGIRSYRHTKRLSWWINNLAGDIARLVQFVIDRRYHLSVRLTAAYYLLFVRKWAGLCTFVPLFHDALLRICQEGSRRGINPSTLQPLQATVTFEEDLMRIMNCEVVEIPAVIIDSSENMTSSLVHYYWVRSLRLRCLDIHTKSDLEAAERASQTIGSRLYRLAPDLNPLECALKSEVQELYDRVNGEVKDKRVQIERREFVEHMVRMRE